MESSIMEINKQFKEKLGLEYFPVGIYLEKNIPENALSYKQKGNGCIANLIFQASKGKTVAIGNESTGYPCSAFYLGYQEWIFPGIENFLSNGPFPGRECERIINNAATARKFVENYIPDQINTETYVFRPLSETEDRLPKAVIFFANPDQMSALVQLAHFNSPLDEHRVVTQFSSACMSLVTFPMRYAKKRESKAFWGIHDISVRLSFPENITTLAMPYFMYEEMGCLIDESFLNTERWEKVLARITQKISLT